MDYAALKAADAALGIDDLVAARDALAAQSMDVDRDIPVGEARSLLWKTGEWGAIVLLSRVQSGGAVPDALIGAAITGIDVMTNGTTISTTDPDAWAAAQQMIGAYLQAGKIKQTTHDALLALREVTVPRWPGLTVGDIQTARAQP